MKIEYTKEQLEGLLDKLLKEALEAGAYYSDCPSLHDLLQDEGALKEYRLSKGIKYSHED